MTSPSLRSAAQFTAEAVLIVVVCLQLAPMTSRTMVAAASGYVQASLFGPYDRMVFSHLHQRPFEQCAGIEALHQQSLQRIEQALPAIEASSRFEPVRLFRAARLFNQESQRFYWSECPQAWTYFYSYVDYQSWLTKVAPIIWVVERWHASEIHVVLLLTLASWFGIACAYWVTKRLSGSAFAGIASLVVLWFAFSPFAPRWFSPTAFGAGLPLVDIRLNLFTTFALLGLAQLLCDRPSDGRRFSASAADVGTAAAFAACALLMIFLRLPPSRLDATVLIGCLVAVAAVRRDLDLFRRAILVLILVTAVQWPFQRFSATLLGPVSAVNSAASDEFKLVNAVEFLNERPTHFGNFILDFNNTWIHDGDYYLRRLSHVYALHHGYPAWGRRFLEETAVWHPTEIPNAWWKRFAVQIIFHEDLSYGVYGAHPRLGTAVFWLATALGFTILIGGRRSSPAWPLMGLIFWEVYGLHTFLALMHVHYLYFLKGMWMLWCATPCLAVLTVREVRAWRPLSWNWPRLPRREGRARTWAAAGAVIAVVAGLWFVRELRKEVHVTHVWRAVHGALVDRQAFLPVDDLVREIDAIRDLGGEAPGTVSMYGAWVLFGYIERAASYTQGTGRSIDTASVKQLMIRLYKRALAEGPGNPHFYTYARYLDDPDWPAVFDEGLKRFPDHPYRVMMSWALATSGAPVLPEEVRARSRAVYDRSVRETLRESESYRPGFRPLPAVTATSPVARTADGQAVTARPGEVVSIESFPTYGTDRLALGLYLQVLDGEVRGSLVDAYGSYPTDPSVMTPGDNFPYRAWAFDRLDGRPVDRAGGPDDRRAHVELVAGPAGARVVIRDLYPLVENPRWFR